MGSALGGGLNVILAEVDVDGSALEMHSCLDGVIRASRSSSESSMDPSFRFDEQLGLVHSRRSRPFLSCSFSFPTRSPHLPLSPPLLPAFASSHLSPALSTRPLVTDRVIDIGRGRSIRNRLWDRRFDDPCLSRLRRVLGYG